MSVVYLKIKIMSLAAEATIIRREQSRWSKQSDIWSGLRHHRIEDVRTEARAALLAYGFLRGRPYAALEAKTDCPPNWDRVLQLARKYGPNPKLAADFVKAWAGSLVPAMQAAA